MKAPHKSLALIGRAAYKNGSLKMVDDDDGQRTYDDGIGSAYEPKFGC